MGFHPAKGDSSFPFDDLYGASYMQEIVLAEVHDVLGTGFKSFMRGRSISSAHSTISHGMLPLLRFHRHLYPRKTHPDLVSTARITSQVVDCSFSRAYIKVLNGALRWAQGSPELCMNIYSLHEAVLLSVSFLRTHHSQPMWII